MLANCMLSDPAKASSVATRRAGNQASADLPLLELFNNPLMGRPPADVRRMPIRISAALSNAKIDNQGDISASPR